MQQQKKEKKEQTKGEKCEIPHKIYYQKQRRKADIEKREKGKKSSEQNESVREKKCVCVCWIV